MVSIVTQRDRRAVRDLAFCYLCRGEFEPSDVTDHDHVPPETMFPKPHREPLKLRTHVKCNHVHHLVDEKIGQLIALRRREAAKPPSQLRFRRTNIGTAIWNLDVDAAVWRWISGFHAALYREPLRLWETGVADLPYARSLVLPFPKGSKDTRVLEPLLGQHFRLVETIKVNRYLRNLDRLECNKGNVVYECAWAKYDNKEDWFCAFALDICDWKELGAITPKHARGCAGHYMLDTKQPPVGGARAKRSALLLPNFDKADPFAP